MAFKARIAAGAAALALAAGSLGMAGTLSASAATSARATTPPCGSDNCSSIWSLKFHERFPLDVYHGPAAAGQPIILFQASNSDPAEDFYVTDLGTVDSFYDHHHNLISPAFDQAYGSEEAFEIEYTPYGHSSHFCVGTQASMMAQPGSPVMLEPCGQLPGTIWAQDTNPNDGQSPVEGYSAYINGATNSFTNPLVLNYPAGNPTDWPRVQLNVQPLENYSDGTIFDNQLWNGIGYSPTVGPPTVPVG